MGRFRALIAALLAVVALVSATACTGVSLDAGDNQGFISGAGIAESFPKGEREAAPEVSGATLEGESVALSDFHGDVVVVNVWGSWCAPCRGEAPALQEVFHKTQKHGVQFIGLNTRDQIAAAQAFEETFGITYPSLDDQSGELQLLFRDVVPLEAIPSTVVIDRDGNIAARVVGPTTYSQLSDLVDEIASEK